MAGQVQRFQPCRQQGCTRGTNDSSHLCHKHRYLQKSYTRGGQLVFSSGGPLGVIPRLAMEQSVRPPQGDDAMEIDGFPYFSAMDQKKYVDWKVMGAERPSNSEVIARYPVQVTDVPGARITGDEIGVYDSHGTLFTFDHTAQCEEDSGHASGAAVRVFKMDDGSSFAINSQSVYQVVIFDRDKLGSHL